MVVNKKRAHFELKLLLWVFANQRRSVPIFWKIRSQVILIWAFRKKTFMSMWESRFFEKWRFLANLHFKPFDSTMEHIPMYKHEISSFKCLTICSQKSKKLYRKPEPHRNYPLCSLLFRLNIKQWLSNHLNLSDRISEMISSIREFSYTKAFNKWIERM